MSDPFFNQAKAKTHTGTKKEPKAKPVAFTAYEETEANLSELMKKLAEMTGTSENKSTTIRTAIAYALRKVSKDEKLIHSLYNENRSKR